MLPRSCRPDVSSNEIHRVSVLLAYGANVNDRERYGVTALHYADGLNTPKDNAFRLAYAKAYKLQPDVYAVQGYDAAQMLAIGLAAVKGDVKKTAEFAAALEKAKIDSPRGAFTISKSHNPVQDFYLRQVVGKENKSVGIASKALADPGRGCRL